MAKSLNVAELEQASGGAIYIAGKDDAEIGAKKDDVVVTGLINGKKSKQTSGRKKI